MVASIGAIASASQGVSYYEKDGYYAKDDAAHKEPSAWRGRGGETMGLSGPVEPDAFERVLEGHVPDGRQLGKKDRDGNFHPVPFQAGFRRIGPKRAEITDFADYRLQNSAATWA